MINVQAHAAQVSGGRYSWYYMYTRKKEEEKGERLRRRLLPSSNRTQCALKVSGAVCPLNDTNNCNRILKQVLIVLIVDNSNNRFVVCVVIMRRVGLFSWFS